MDNKIARIVFVVGAFLYLAYKNPITATKIAIVAVLFGFGAYGTFYLLDLVPLLGWENTFWPKATIIILVSLLALLAIFPLLRLFRWLESKMEVR